MPDRKIYNEILQKQLILPEKCERIISFSPAITESLFLMGLGELVKGVSVYCVHPEEARQKIIVGSYNSFKEKVIDQINPDIIFTTTGYQLELIKNLKDKYPVYPLRLPPTLAELIANSVEVGIVAGYYDEARNLEDQLFEELINLRTKNNFKLNRIYIEIDLGGPVSFGAFSYITDGINFIGGKNIFQNESCEWLTPEDKKVAELNPDIIIYEPKMFTKNRDREIIKDNLTERFGEIEALKYDRLFITPGIYDFFAHHGPGFILKSLKWLKEILGEINRDY
ncbi:MAG: ABC transporter substrate-binding protein [Ignavibacteria bacterium]